MTTLQKEWYKQVEYNLAIRSKDQPFNYEYWMEKYILGAVSEIDEILSEMNWKIHRRGHTVDKHNLARELADLTKYVWCMWEHSGFTADEMLQFVAEKSDELTERHGQDFENDIPEGTRVLITDIDGTLGNYRKAFYGWLLENHRETLPQDSQQSLAMEVDLGLGYLEYEKYKDEFEATGGYKYLDLYLDTEDVITTAWTQGITILVYTARPAHRYGRIWADTWGWLKHHNLDICITALHIGSTQRIAKACELQMQGCAILLLEDDPALALRAAHAGIKVLLKNQPYNAHIEHPKIMRYDKFHPSELIHEQFEKEQK